MTAAAAVEALRALHVAIDAWYEESPGGMVTRHVRCRCCRLRWPCTTKLLLDEVEMVK